MWEIRTAGPKGLGVFAKSFIPRGTRIFSERPLLAIRQDQDASSLYHATRQLSLDDRALLLKLSAHTTNETSLMRWTQAFWYILKQTSSDLKTKLSAQAAKPPLRFSLPSLISIKEHVSILNIFRSNAFNLGLQSKYHQAVFPRISRINHSCIPNAQANFHELLGRFNVHSTRDIEIDEEVNLNYLDERGSLREVRRGRLLQGYGFLCGCEACDFEDGVEGSKLGKGGLGEEKRAKMLEVLRVFSELPISESDAAAGGIERTEEELRVMKLFIELLEGERIAGREVGTMYLEAARLNQKLGRYEHAFRCAERGLAIERDCLGVDHPLYLESLEFVGGLKDGKV